jgi:hypothetical protein
MKRKKKKPEVSLVAALRIYLVFKWAIHNIYLSRFFDCLVNPNLSEILATDQK